MGWEQRGAKRYYYRKERSGTSVKSVYVGRGEIAHLIANFESHSTDLDKLLRAKKPIEADELERVEAVLDRAIELTQLFTEASLLTAGFHAHKRQWRRKRS
jgi:hypothetical protein